MLKLRLLDLCCCAGGCSVGYNRAGFEVVGIDIKEQKNYPFEFIKGDVTKLNLDFLREFDVIHASPPCQSYSCTTASIRKTGDWTKVRRYYDLDILSKVRELLIASGKPYIIENVRGIPLLRNPVMLCGTHFGLGVIRHRFFESNVPLRPKIDFDRPGLCKHVGTVKNGDFASVVGSGGFGGGKSDLKTWSVAMGIDWMTKKELTQAIPPAYTEFLGKQLYDYIVNRRLSVEVNNEMVNVNTRVLSAVYDG